MQYVKLIKYDGSFYETHGQVQDTIEHKINCTIRYIIECMNQDHNAMIPISQAVPLTELFLKNKAFFLELLQDLEKLENIDKQDEDGA